MVQTITDAFILKGCEDFQSMKSSIVLSQLLHKQGFKFVIEYVELTNGLYFEENLFWTLFPDIFHPKENFPIFSKKTESMVLQYFHLQTTKLIHSLEVFIPKENLIQKWDTRLHLFEKNLPRLSQWFNKALISEIIYYSRVALEKLKETAINKGNELDVVLHG
jgi:hypothetical protein